ncbi:telomere-protecting terminal protein Tpg [Streptomyces sp. NPDC102441]|uniref:telomere-protecting terminal protein Tpg n=1 Tax=Streptomyces sp. NPDC102441 TaxID=3366176 RepID=UPI00381E14B2
MGPVGESLNRATAQHFTRPVPRSPAAQLRYLLKMDKGHHRRTAARLNITTRTVRRYLNGQTVQPRPALASRLRQEVHTHWQPRARNHAAARQAAVTGLTVETRATFGYTAARGTTDESRPRRLTQRLTPEYATPLLQAHAQRAGEGRLVELVAAGLQDSYFRDGGHRATGLRVELHEIDYIDIRI